MTRLAILAAVLLAGHLPNGAYLARIAKKMHSWGGEIYRSASLSGALRCLRGRRMGTNERQGLISPQRPGLSRLREGEREAGFILPFCYAQNA